VIEKLKPILLSAGANILKLINRFIPCNLGGYHLGFGMSGKSCPPGKFCMAISMPSLAVAITDDSPSSVPIFYNNYHNGEPYYGLALYLTPSGWHHKPRKSHEASRLCWRPSTNYVFWAQEKSRGASSETPVS